MRRATSARAFSLVEVVIAAGVFAGGVAVVLALLPSLMKQSAESADLRVAQRLPDTVRVALQTEVAKRGFDALAMAIPTVSAPLQHGFALVARRDGTDICPLASADIPAEGRYFVIEARKFDEPPLAHQPGAAMLAIFVRVSWPYRIPGAAGPIAESKRSEFTFVLAAHR